MNEIGSMIKVTAKIMDIERHLDTIILPHYPKDAGGLSSVDLKKTKAILKASSSLKIPKEITAHIAFVSLNTPVSPVSFNKGRKMKTLSARQQGKGAATFTSADKDAGRIFDALLKIPGVDVIFCVHQPYSLLSLSSLSLSNSFC